MVGMGQQLVLSKMGSESLQRFKEPGRRLAVRREWRWGVVLVIGLASADAALSADLRDL